MLDAEIEVGGALPRRDPAEPLLVSEPQPAPSAERIDDRLRRADELALLLGGAAGAAKRAAEWCLAIRLGLTRKKTSEVESNGDTA